VNDREARPTVRTIYERVSISAVLRVKHLTQAIAAGCDIGRNQRVDCLFGVAANDAKFQIAIAGKISGADIGDSRQWRSFAREARNKVVDSCTRALNFDQHTRRRVPNCAYKLAFCCKSINEWAKTDALHYAGNINLTPDAHDYVGTAALGCPVEPSSTTIV
jgi:hypothetical protein